MRLGIFGDVHGNLAGLEIVLAHLKDQGVDQLVCLGDLVDGGPEESGVIDRIRFLDIACVRGNHDICNTALINHEQQAFLDGLPDSLTIENAYFTHISPRKIRIRKVADGGEAFNVFDECELRRIFVGHSHVSQIFTNEGVSPTWADEHVPKFARPFSFAPSVRAIVSVGAVGYNRDAFGGLRTGIYDTDLDTVTIYRLPGPTISVA